MRRKRIFIISVICVAFLVTGTVLGALVARYIWTTEMGMRLVGSYDVALEYFNGTEILSYNWGDFNNGEIKALNASLHYKGNSQGYIQWNTSLPLGWNMTVGINTPSNTWGIGATLNVTSNSYTTLIIVLREINAVVNQNETFALNFTSYEIVP